MMQVKFKCTGSRLLVLLAVAFLGACQTPKKTDFSLNVPPLERYLINALEQQGPGDRAVINRVQVHEEVVDWYTITLLQDNPYSALSESGSGQVGKGSVVQFCGRGEFLGIAIFTEYAYLCKRGEGLVFGVTSHGWVHLYGKGEIGDKIVNLPKPN